MQILILILLFILGTALGSGLNALAARLQHAQSWTRERSACPHCRRELRWWELIPLVSFILLGRRCSSCNKKISWQYPLAELAAGGLLTLSYVTFGATVGAVVAAVASIILLFIYIYDGRTMLIPDPAVWSFNALAMLSLFLNPAYDLLNPSGQFFVTPDWLAVAAGPMVALPLLLIWLGSRGRAMGFGDVKLTLGTGWLLGISAGFTALIFAFWIGAVVSLALLGTQLLWKRYSLKTDEAHTMETAGQEGNDPDTLSLHSAVPFGPFLILGWLVVFFSNITLF